MINGNLLIRPLSAKLTHDTEHFSKMDPYVRVTVGSECKSSNAAKKQHMNPSWDCELSFRLNGQDVIYFEVFNKETFSKDDLVGSGSLFTNNLVNKGLFSEWVPLQYKDQPAGELLLEVQFFPDSGNLNTNQGMGNMNVGTTGNMGGMTTGTKMQGNYMDPNLNMGGKSTGYTGTTGMTTGSTGYGGQQGNTGYGGQQGNTGYGGQQGTTGYVGQQGTTGYVGQQGTTGYSGGEMGGLTGSGGVFQSGTTGGSNQGMGGNYGTYQDQNKNWK